MGRSLFVDRFISIYECFEEHLTPLVKGCLSMTCYELYQFLGPQSLTIRYISEDANDVLSSKQMMKLVNLPTTKSVKKYIFRHPYIPQSIVNNGYKYVFFWFDKIGVEMYDSTYLQAYAKGMVYSHEDRGPGYEDYALYH